MLPQISRLLMHNVWRTTKEQAVNLAAARCCLSLGQINSYKSGILNINLGNFVSNEIIQQFGRDNIETLVVVKWTELSE